MVPGAMEGLPAGATLGADSLIGLRNLALAAARPAALASLPGGFTTRRKGSGLEVADLREYVAGDDLRHIDHAATARTGRPHVRQFQAERDRVVLLIADLRPSMFWGLTRAFRSVAVAEVLVLVGWGVVETGGRVALLAITAAGPVVVPPRGRVRGMLDVIAGLVEAHRTGLAALAGRAGHRNPAGQADPPLDVALARAERLAPAGAELVLASGFDSTGADLPDRLNALDRRRSVALISVTAASTGRMPPGRYRLRLPDGRRLGVRLGSRQRDHAESEMIAGRPAFLVDAADPVDLTARRLAARTRVDRPT
jgi:uncharacterized protein (DUF58 family)